MRLVFGNANIAVLVRSSENLVLTDNDIGVGTCGGTPTDDVNTPFKTETM